MTGLNVIPDISEVIQPFMDYMDGCCTEGCWRQRWGG